MLLSVEQGGRPAASSVSLFVTFSHLTHHSSHSALQSINLSICLQNKLLTSTFLFSSDAHRQHLYFPFFMWIQYTPSVARKPYEHFFFPLGQMFDYRFGWRVRACVHVHECVCLEAGLCMCVSPRESSCQAELWVCSSIQPSNNNEPLTMLDRAQSLSSPVAMLSSLCKSLWDLFPARLFKSVPDVCIYAHIQVFCTSRC